jgi:hypothetical protein
MTRATELGLRVTKPWGDNAPYDLAVEANGRFLRVQVKCTRFRRGRSYIKRRKKRQKARDEVDSGEQNSFLELFFHLDPKMVQALIANAGNIRLTQFEIESLKNIRWFQFLCERSGSPKNYPDVFHLWAAERNGLNIFLTLDNRLLELVSRVKGEKRKTINTTTQVLRPMELLNILGIHHTDAGSLEEGRFYHLHQMN